mmetsp:Transcript_27626/g.86678  ORF Transcript_27626/g.86678 Transcript_27626/m.86678 type:complete len:211 (-) Transcript_27626:343-975(-)
MKIKGWGWFTLLVPVLGPSLALKMPTFDDIAKVLQLFGLVSALILSVVAGDASYSDAYPNSRTIQGRAYSAFGFCVVSIVHVLITYIYLVTCVDQAGEKSSDAGKKRKADIQMKNWWYLGKVNIFLQISFIIMALIEYITYVNATLISGYNLEDYKESDISWYDNYYGFFVGWAGIMCSLLFVLLTVHILALPAILNNGDEVPQPFHMWG